MNELCENISKLSRTYFFEPDSFTQNNWELGNKLWDVASFELTTSGLGHRELSAFEKELLDFKNH